VWLVWRAVVCVAGGGVGCSEDEMKRNKKQKD
jgi:hypothetical protein